MLILDFQRADKRLHLIIELRKLALSLNIHRGGGFDLRNASDPRSNTGDLSKLSVNNRYVTTMKLTLLNVLILGSCLNECIDFLSDLREKFCHSVPRCRTVLVVLANSRIGALLDKAEYGREFEGRLRAADFAEVRHNLLRQRETEVDEFRDDLAEGFELWHEMSLYRSRVLDEVLKTFGKLSALRLSVTNKAVMTRSTDLVRTLVPRH